MARDRQEQEASGGRRRTAGGVSVADAPPIRYVNVQWQHTALCEPSPDDSPDARLRDSSDESERRTGQSESSCRRLGTLRIQSRHPCELPSCCPPCSILGLGRANRFRLPHAQAVSRPQSATPEHRDWEPRTMSTARSWQTSLELHRVPSRSSACPETDHWDARRLDDWSLSVIPNGHPYLDFGAVPGW